MNAIRVNNISKLYFVNSPNQQRGQKSLKHDLAHIPKTIIHFIRPSKKQKFWALSTISFNLDTGDVLGIIGANGSGKSTLLKILSRITSPTKGEAIIQGKVSSLLEIGVGFHPELTGRDNIYLTGALLGVSKKIIKKEFKSIVEFSGVEKFIETPVKYYSSGMYLRLAFSVITHPYFAPDILLIDEILAVGDEEFRRKSFMRIQEFIKDKKTIILVSHNLKYIEDLCNTCMWLEKGKIKMTGNPKTVTSSYLKSNPPPPAHFIS